MAKVDLLPESPSGQITFGDVREKVNELTALVNRNDVLTGGWFYVLNSDSTPIATLDGVATTLTNDGSSIVSQTPEGTTSIWNSLTNQFDFSSLQVGDLVRIRVDVVATTASTNDTVTVNLQSAIGSASEFALPLASQNRFISGTVNVSAYSLVVMGSQDIIDNPSELQVIIDGADASAYMVSFVAEVVKYGMFERD